MKARAQIAGHPIHPMLIPFPVGLWVAGFAFDLAGLALEDERLWSAGWYAMLAGCVGAALAAVAGALDLFTVVPPRSSGKRRGYVHAVLNVTALVLFVVTLVLLGSPSVRPGRLSVLLSGLGVLVVGISGWLGGTLVYRNQVGVDRRYAGAGKWRERTVDSWERPICGENEIAYGQMLLVHIDGERIVVGRCADGIVAYSDHCTHRGGPLSDGTLIGCTVQCPWHGSQFDTHTGRVVAGPANVQITTYDVVMRGGEVYLSAPAHVRRAA